MAYPASIATTIPRLSSEVDRPVVWILASANPSQQTSPLTVVHPIPFSIGRKSGNSLQFSSRAVSSQHAELDIHEGKLILKDLQSTNGTYVNGQRVTSPVVLKVDDLVQIADVAFRVRCDDHATATNTISENICDQALALIQFDRMMETRMVTPFFQPIIDVSDASVRGFEVLARSRMFGIETSAAMFSAASRLNMEVELSQMLRWEGIREALSLPDMNRMYLNTHPLELDRDDLVRNVAATREYAGDMPITLEIHEAAVTNPVAMRELRKAMRDIQVNIAYDDFGAGQNRLTELIESPPDVLKFDMSLIRNIDRATPERQRMVASLVRIVLDLGVTPLAEGIETAEEAEVCGDIGFQLAQGYFYGRPMIPKAIYCNT
ncbi:MAG: EAL domain-containing protein [Planctomycetota bacterium]|nr:EAL domain-containing protein [Planctomycetota bacterium]